MQVAFVIFFFKWTKPAKLVVVKTCFESGFVAMAFSSDLLYLAIPTAIRVIPFARAAAAYFLVYVKLLDFPSVIKIAIFLTPALPPFLKDIRFGKAFNALSV